MFSLSLTGLKRRRFASPVPPRDGTTPGCHAKLLGQVAKADLVSLAASVQVPWFLLGPGTHQIREYHRLIEVLSFYLGSDKLGDVFTSLVTMRGCRAGASHEKDLPKRAELKAPLASEQAQVIP